MALSSGSSHGATGTKGVRVFRSGAGTSSSVVKGYTTGLGPRRGSTPAGIHNNIANTGSRKSGRRGLR